MDAIFDYDQLGNYASDAREAIARIRARRSEEVVEIGRVLIEIRRNVGHGHFMALVAAECDFTERTARSKMAAAKWVDAKTENISVLPLLPKTVLYAMPAASIEVPDIVDELVSEYLGGARPPAKEVRARIDAARADVTEAKAIADNVLVELRHEKVTGRQRQLAVVFVLRQLRDEITADCLLEALAGDPPDDAADIDDDDQLESVTAREHPESLPVDLAAE